VKWSIVKASDVVEKKFRWEDVPTRGWVQAWIRERLTEKQSMQFALLAGYRRVSKVWMVNSRVAKALMMKPEWESWMKNNKGIHVDVQNHWDKHPETASEPEPDDSTG